MAKTNKLVIIGAGHVGSYVLADAMKLGMFSEIGIIDRNKGVAFGEALDQEHVTGLPYMENTTVTHGSYEQCEDADIIVFSASEKLGQEGYEKGAIIDRTNLTTSSSTIIRESMKQITEYTKEAIIICITNPVDIVTYIAENEFDYPKGKIFGTGTMLDSARLRQVIANNYGIDPKSVTAYMMGEHGTTAFPVLSHANVLGIPFSQLNNYFNSKQNISDPEKLAEKVVKLAYDVYWGKGWTNAAIAHATITLIKAVLLDEKSIYPVSVTLKKEYNFKDKVVFGTPCIIGKNGVEKVLSIELNEWETKKLQESVNYIKNNMNSVENLG